jgi:outer membrane protein OmpA-like peptidoglycan-associated protein
MIEGPLSIFIPFLVFLNYNVLENLFQNQQNQQALSGMKQLSLLAIIIGITATAAFCQKVTLDGYVFEELNRGYLNEVKVTVLDKSGVYIGETLSDMAGHFTFDVEAGKEYDVQYEKKIFQRVSDPVSTVGKKAGDKVFLKRQLERQPGYLLEVTLADKRFNESVNVDAINGARIEIFNLTSNREELVIDSAKSPVFSQTLLQGYHYVIMIRKKGYFTRRMDAHVNIDGCYLCMEGFGTVTPGMVSNITSARDNKIGTLLANVDLTKIDTNQNIVFQNIYYAYNSSELTEEAVKELDKVTSLLQNNGALVVELGSHTDSRGSAESNLRLSQARAESAVEYILGSGSVDRKRLKAKGYGETHLTNKCEDGTPCSEAEHVRNRRTELKIIGFTLDPNEGRSLAEIVHAEEMAKFIKAGESQKEYKATAATPAVVSPSTETPKTYKTPEATPSVSVVNSAKTSALEAPVTRVSVKNAEIPSNIPQGEPKTKVTPNTPTPSKPPALTIKQLESGEPPMASSKPNSQVSMPQQRQMPPNTAATMQQLESGSAPMPKETLPPPVVKPTQKPVVVTTPQPTAVAVVTPKPKMENVKVNVSPIETAFSGYKVEVFTSPSSLMVGADEIQQIAGTILSEIAVDKLKNGEYSYMVGTFLNWSETERFLEKVQTKYDKARIVEYFNGKRIGQ